MLGESEDAKLVQTGNATLRNKHFYKSWQDPDYEKVKIKWPQAVQETYGPNGDKALTRDFVEKEKQELPPNHFKSMYECEFPDEEQSGLISYKDIREAQDKEFPKNEKAEEPIILYGLDVAREGRDHSVLTRVEKHGSIYRITDVESWDIADTVKLAEKVMVFIVLKEDGEINKYKEQLMRIRKKTNQYPDINIPWQEVLEDCDYTRINVDSHGIGAGVLDTLRSKGVYATGVKVGVSSRKALKRPDDFQDLKAEFYDKVRKIFESGDIFFSGEFPRLINELNDLETEKNTRNKIRVVDPNKSPDFADSLMLAVSVDKPRKQNKAGKAKLF